MKKFIALALALLFAFTMTAVVFASEPAKPAATPKAEEKKAELAKETKKAAIKQITGEVVAVDAAAKTITVKGKKAEVTLSADEKMLKDIKAGDKVTAKYTEQDGKMAAKSIKKAAEKEAPKAEEKKAEPAKK